MDEFAESIGKLVIALMTLVFWLILIVVFSVISAWFISLAWNWTVPDLFKGLVEKGLLPGTIDWFQAFKLSLLLGFLGISTRSTSSSSSSSKK